jgi:hypothetical protein
VIALQLGALREALEDAGARPEKAARAAEELASHDNRFAGINQEFEKVRGDINLLRWMVGANLALTLIVLGSLFTMWSELGEIEGQLSQIAHVAH